MDKVRFQGRISQLLLIKILTISIVPLAQPALTVINNLMETINSATTPCSKETLIL